jgi:phospholipid/cholesterol/gamma-HCH transport system substrate-binding protein
MDTPKPPPAPSDSPAALERVERKATVLLLLISALVLGFLLYVMYARGVFERTQRLVLVADDSEGVIVGMDLTFSGFPIGRVQRIELGASGKARILIDVPLKDAAWLRSSSIFTMERGMVGDTRIRAFSGVLSDPPLPDQAERNVLRGDTNAEIPRIVASARALLENLDSMTRPDASINTSLGHLQTVTERLAGPYGVLTGMLGSETQAKKVIATLDQTNTLLRKADQRIFGAQGLMDSTQATVDSTQAAAKQLVTLLTDVRGSLQKLDGVLVEAQAIAVNTRVASADLGALRAEVELSLRKVSQLVEEVNRKWPFARDTEIKLP